MKKLAVKIEFKEVNAVDPQEVAEVAEAYARLIDMMFCMRLKKRMVFWNHPVPKKCLLQCCKKIQKAIQIHRYQDIILNRQILHWEYV